MLKHPLSLIRFRVQKIFQKDKCFGFGADLHSECQVCRQREPKKSHRLSSTHIHPNFKLQDDLSPRNAFLYNSINISSSIFGTDKFLIKYVLYNVGLLTRKKKLPLQFLALLCGLRCSCSHRRTQGKYPKELFCEDLAVIQQTDSIN